MARPARISREVVLRTALDIADTAGLDAVTMQAVADRLGVTPMALYRHVTGKAGLLDGLVELMLISFAPAPTRPPSATPAPATPAPDEPRWEDRLTALAHGVRESARRHPAVFPLLLQRPAETPQARRIRDSVHTALEEAGVDRHQVPRLERLISTAVLGFAVSEAAGRFRRHEQHVIDEDFRCLLQALGDLVRRHAITTG